ncbi:hypothetical protein [Teichococcus aestuarii]|uniref:hypothetical protein n=1 Tax=Teichococcus aestuarii TaxID=568898 RepID=UPI00360DFB77
MGQELAAQRRDVQRAEATRVAALSAHDRRAAQERAAARVGILQSDRGADGAAMRARPICHSGVPGSSALATADHDPLVALGLTECQEEAAGWLRQYWRDALPALALPKGWGSGGRAVGQELTGDQERAARTAWRQYQAWMELIQRDCGTRPADAVRALVIQHEPHPAMASVPAALDYLAAHMGLP